MAALAAAVIAGNNAINCFDIGKDNTIGFPGGKLSNAVHGDYIKNDIIGLLFELARLPAEDFAKVQGVGDRKEHLKAKIDASFRLNNLEKQQVIRPEFSASGGDYRLQGLTVAHDAGVGAKKLFKTYRNLVTPASILDPAQRDKNNHPELVGALNNPSTIDINLIRQLNMEKCLTEIRFIGRVGGQYTFEFYTTIAGYTQLEVKFDSNSFDETSIRNVTPGGLAFRQPFSLFAGNPFKNGYIFNEWDRSGGAPPLNETHLIALLTLMKELGDTLQVMWLLLFIRTPEMALAPDRTAICTIDIPLWLRAIVNGVSCVLTHGQVTTFYPVAGSEAQRVAARTLLKTQLVNQLNNSHQDALNTVQLFITKLERGEELTFHDRPIVEPIRGELLSMLKCVLKHVTTVSRDVIRTAGLIQPGDIDGVREYVKNNMMRAPFIVANLKSDIKVTGSDYRYFIPKGARKIAFKPYEDIYRSIQQKIGLNIARIMGDIPYPCPGPAAAAAAPAAAMVAEQAAEEAAAAAAVAEEAAAEAAEAAGAAEAAAGEMGGGGGDIPNTNVLGECLRNNISNPGFFTYLIQNYIPELLFVGISYVISYQGTAVAKKYSLLLDHGTATIVGSIFGKIRYGPLGHYFEVFENPDMPAGYARSPQYMQYLDSLTLELLCVVFASYDAAILEAQRVTIYDFCTRHIIDEIVYLIAFFTANAPTMLSATPQLLSHLNATILSYSTFCSNRDNNAHFKAISMYETLFNIESYLTIGNMREMKNPLQVYLLTPAQKAAKRVTKRNNIRSVKRRTTAAAAPLTIADKLRAASTRRLSALGRRRAAAQYNNNNNNNGNGNGNGSTVPFYLGGGSKTRKRMRRKHKKTGRSNK